MKIKLLTPEVAVTTANNVNNSKLVRVAITTGSALLTLKDAEGTTIGTMTLLSTTPEYIVKTPTDTIEANTSIRAVSVAFLD